MKIEWKDNSANVGRLELCVRHYDHTGKWNAMVFLGNNQVGSRHDFNTDADARAWCERWVEFFVGPMLAAASAEAALAEREACAAEVDAFAAQVQSEIDSTWPVGHKLDQLVAARTVLQKAVAMIRARSNSGRAAPDSPAPERS